jgi:hypothetical protein
MITRIPALEFMQRAVGIYQSPDQFASLQITRCGYGQVVEFRSGSKVQFAGVVGAAGNSVEFFVQLGLPNVVRMSGDLQLQNAISFKAQEPPSALLFTVEGDSLALTVSLGGAASAHHLLQRVSN